MQIKGQAGRLRADGTKYLHKNDVIWKQITEKGTLSPNR